MSGNEFCFFKSESDMNFNAEVDFEISFSWSWLNLDASAIFGISIFMKSSKAMAFVMFDVAIQKSRVVKKIIQETNN